MTIKEKIQNDGISMPAYSPEDFIGRVRPAIFGGLSDEQKHSFIRMAKREQEIYIEAVLRELGIKMPAV